MAQTTAQVKAEVVAIYMYEPSDKMRGCGTAFWAEVCGARKLVTAAHIPWHRDKVNVVPDNEVLLVRWATATATASGEGEAIVTSHTPGTDLDYATIEFIDDANKPLGKTFSCGAMPAVGDKVACIGFPGSVAVRADGTVDDVQSGAYSKATVSGTACEGYSGGPIFTALPNGDLGDNVIGLMRGAPPLEGANPNPDGTVPPDLTKFIMFGAVSFN